MMETAIEKEEKTEEEKAETEAIVKTSENSEILKTALVFGQSEDELRREFKEYKALKLFRKIYCDLTRVKSESFEDKLDEVVSLGFGGVIVFPTQARKAKEKIGKADVKVVAAVCYPFGEEGANVKKTATKKVSAWGANGVLVPVGINSIKADNLDFIRREIKRCVKVNKSLKIIALLECGELTGEEIERTVKTLCAVGVKSFCSGSGFFGGVDGISLKSMRSGLKADCEIVATEKKGEGSDVISLFSIADKVITADGERVAREIRSRLGC